jgi:hypothetical protein
MKVLESWVVDNCKMLVFLENNTYKIGVTTNIYGFTDISEEEALSLIRRTREKESEDKDYIDYSSVSTPDLINLRNYLLDIKDEGVFDPNYDDFVYPTKEESDQAYIECAMINAELKRRAVRLRAKI